MRGWVSQFAKPLTTKVTNVHEGDPENKAFVILRVLGGLWVLRGPRRYLPELRHSAPHLWLSAEY
jgi:hypothetical protein